MSYENRIALGNLVPVSYTHLDVYKRQVERLHDPLVRRAVSGCGYSALAVCNAAGGRHCRRHRDFPPVSYTHLDVYKRQVDYLVVNVSEVLHELNLVAAVLEVCLLYTSRCV